ncbi:McrC family protein [Aquipseudomonas alcaligenes]|uniref:5-methylcytosine-specific restriction enzyme subunit McrC n=1 Tax=Aquipseudomonas alcaligenes TaxID=43263 RepID=A0A1N6WD23_AQUAC|nr:McrC family protein [Pseudomonas alcaligenes]SIQ87912.1 5-methylcytosine-specific restriction enzyme subunit McrC [Pseudomonas alcaligenes]
MAGITIFEFDAMAVLPSGSPDMVGLHRISADVFAWLETQALRNTEAGESTWLRLTQRHGRRAIQVKSFVGVIRCPDGFQIEVLPKLGKANGEGDARQLLIEMLCCLGSFRHIQTNSAQLQARRMPLLEVFIAEFLRAVDHAVKRGLRSDYRAQQDNLFALRGKLNMAQHLSLNLCRRDRFYTEFDEFSLNRPENRLLHTALKRVLKWTASQANQQLARELCFVFADIPTSDQVNADFGRIRPDRGMAHYDAAMAWARLILRDESPLTGTGQHLAPSLLFPMEAIFEAFVAKHLARQLNSGHDLRPQTRSLRLVRHKEQDWFQLKPDLLVQTAKTNRLVLDTKWKLIDAKKANSKEKYGLDQSDFYQLQAYGQSYLDGDGDVILIYPKTETLSQPLEVFDFPKSPDLRLWVLPFCLRTKQMLLPPCGSLTPFFSSAT